MRSIKLPSWTERLLGFEPLPSPPHVFALDEGGLRYGSFHRGPQGFVFESYRSEPLPAGMFGSGLLGATLSDPPAFRSLLGAFLEAFEPPVAQASLLLPDAWLRVTFTELSELPAKADQREQVLRWKLKRLVPFRVEDLRVSATEVAPLPDQEEPVRLLLGFAVESLLAQIEKAFTAHGIRLGRITNTTLALLASLEQSVQPGTLGGLVLVGEDHYTVSFVRDGEPVLYRYKAFADELPEHQRGPAVRRDLRLTRNFVAERIPDTEVARLFLVAPADREAVWMGWLGDELAVTPEPLTMGHLPLARTQAGLPWTETAPLLGAAALEVR